MENAISKDYSENKESSNIFSFLTSKLGNILQNSLATKEVSNPQTIQLQNTIPDTLNLKNLIAGHTTTTTTIPPKPFQSFSSSLPFTVTGVKNHRTSSTFIWLFILILLIAIIAWFVYKKLRYVVFLLLNFDRKKIYH
jgi:hypothetical protein